MTLDIRHASSADVPAIAGLNQHVQELHAQNEPDNFQTWERSVTEAFFEEQLRNPETILWLAEDSGRPVGYLWARFTNPRSDAFRRRGPGMVIDHIAVEPDARRLGVGTALIEQAETEARTRGVQQIDLDFWAFNSAAEAFFRVLGFEPFNIRARRRL